MNIFPKTVEIASENTNDGTSLLEVSQSVPRAGSLGPVLTKYKQYLQSCYSARALAPADKYLPTPNVPYINLAMVGREYCDLDERDEFTKQTLHGGVDQILKSKTPIDIEHLLTPEDSGRPVRFVLVEGPPGIGKSTFAWEVCRRWDEIKSLRDYHTVVLLKLREKWVVNATLASDLFRYPFQPKFSINIAQEHHDSQGQNLLLVIDGFDEVSQGFNEDSVVKSILCRQLLPECTIILTTRPVAKSKLRNICQPLVDKHVEIIGFTEEERVRYITEVFSKEPVLHMDFLKYMFFVPHMKSMMYIPLNCAIIAQVYYECRSSCHLALPRTRTQLYKALTHSLLIRHMKESNNEYTSILPEGLETAYRDCFGILAKFAFDSYHKSDYFSNSCRASESRKVTFFKEDIPKGLVHFGFMNESAEMYASKGVEQTFTFLHLSLQEYLAAWHLANSYSIEFQVAYHKLAVDGFYGYKGHNKDEEALILSLQQQRSSLVEPAIFLAGITGWRSQSENDRNHWEMYLGNGIEDVTDTRVILRSLYEAQNPTILQHYFAAGTGGDYRREITIGSPQSSNVSSPYDCYALSYCLAHSSNEFDVAFSISRDDDTSLVESFVKGLNDHCKSTTPRVKQLKVKLGFESTNMFLFWLIKAQCWTELKAIKFESQFSVSSDLAQHFFQKLEKLQFLHIIGSWECIAALKSLNCRQLNGFYITSNYDHSLYCDPAWKEAVLDFEFPPTTISYKACLSVYLGVDTLLKSVQSNEITKSVLSSISRETMAGVHSILLHCSNLTTLELKRTRLGYDGILYICSALRNNKALKYLVVDDDPRLLPIQTREYGNIKITSFSSMERDTLSSKTTCTDFLLELNNILKHNTTLEEMKIRSGLFLPLSAGVYGEFCKWTGLGPLQQFNVGAVGSGLSPNLRKSFSLSDLTQPQTLLFWDRQFPYVSNQKVEVDFKKLFFKRKEKGKKLFSLPSFTAPDTEVLQSFSGLDPRLKECLEMSDLHEYVEMLKGICLGMLREVGEFMRLANLQLRTYPQQHAANQLK